MPTDHVITKLSTTPVKGLMLHHPDAIEVTADGVIGDRQFFLLDTDGNLQSCTRNAGLFGLRATWDQHSRRLQISRDDTVLIAGTIETAEKESATETDMWGTHMLSADRVADPAWSDFLSEIVGRRVEFLQARGSAYDVAPVTLLGTGSVAELSRHADGPVDAARFRMLVEFSAEQPHVEDTWQGRQLQIGDTVLQAAGPVKRCAATTRNPATGAVDLQTLRMITGYRGRQPSVLGVGANFGVYGTVLRPGRIRVGDRISVGQG